MARNVFSRNPRVNSFEMLSVDHYFVNDALIAAYCVSVCMPGVPEMPKQVRLSAMDKQLAEPATASNIGTSNIP